MKVELGNVADFIRGVTFKPADIAKNFSENSVVCMRTKNVQSSLDETDLISIPEGLVKRKEQNLFEGDILVSTANSWNLVGKCSWVPKLEYPAAVGGFISILRAKDGLLDPRYLYHWFSSPDVQLQARHCGRQTTNISNMDIKQCLKIKIPIPPLSEQKRIAAILDKADALRNKRKESIAKLDELLQSVFLDMFGDPVTNPKGWDTTTIDEIAIVQGGLQLSPTRKSNPIEAQYLRVANVYRGYLVLDEIKLMKVTENEYQRTLLQKGDILVVEGHGNPSEIGRCAVWSGEIATMLHQNHLIRIRATKNIVESRYLSDFLNSESGKRQLTSFGKTTSGLNTINISNVKSMRILLPPISLQLDYVERCQEIIANREKLIISLSEFNKMFPSLQQIAFRGEL